MGMWIAIGAALLLIAFAAIWVVMRKRRSDDDNRVIRSIVLLLAQPHRPSDDEIVTAVRNAWGAKLSREPSESRDFLVHLPSGGSPQCVALRVSGVMYVINSIDSPYGDPEAHKAMTNAHLATIIRESSAWMSVDIFGDPPPDWTSQRLYARLGRLAAQFADDNTLGFYLPEFQQLIPNVRDTLTALTSGDVVANLQDNAPLPIVHVEDNDSEMVAAVEEAKTRLPEFLRLFEEKNPEHQFAIKAPLTSKKSGATEFIWSNVDKIDGSNFLATLANDPADLPEYKVGYRQAIPMDNVVDWIVTDQNGIVVGGFSVKILLERAKR